MLVSMSSTWMFGRWTLQNHCFDFPDWGENLSCFCKLNSNMLVNHVETRRYWDKIAANCTFAVRACATNKRNMCIVPYLRCSTIQVMTGWEKVRNEPPDTELRCFPCLHHTPFQTTCPSFKQPPLRNNVARNSRRKQWQWPAGYRWIRDAI